MKRLALLAGTAAVLLGTAACGGGSPTGGSGSPTTSGPTSTTPAAETTASLAQTKPCSLLSQSQQGQLGITDSSTTQVGGAPDCDLDTSDATVQVAITLNGGLPQINAHGRPVTPLAIGDHQAVKLPSTDGTGGCLLSLGVTAGSRVDIATQPNNLQDSCSFAMQVATLVETHLPSS